MPSYTGEVPPGTRVHCVIRIWTEVGGVASAVPPLAYPTEAVYNGRPFIEQEKAHKLTPLFQFTEDDGSIWLIPQDDILHLHL